MADDSNESGTPTRREYIKYGSTVAVGGLLAGCAGEGGSTPTEQETDTSAKTESSGTDETTAQETTTQGGSYSVAMAPMGEVEFEQAPKTVFTRLTHLADMAFAVGRGNDINAMHAPDYYHALWNQFTERLPGVTLDWQGLYSSWEVSKEKLYELDSDVHLADPASVTALGGWSKKETEEIAQNISPWFGNALSARQQTTPESWADAYEYYGLWEMFEKVSQMFREEARYDALAEIHDGMLNTVEQNLPPVEDRPTGVMVASTNLDSIYAYKMDTPGFLTAHTSPLKPVEAFGNDVESGTTVDFEAMLDADPDVILWLAGMHPSADMADVREQLDGEPVAREISAVKNDRVYAQGARYQGPILNLFQLEMTAKQLYPEQFGEWPTYEEGPYPEIPEGEQLFDRQKVADIINGEL